MRTPDWVVAVLIVTGTLVVPDQAHARIKLITLPARERAFQGTLQQ